MPTPAPHPTLVTDLPRLAPRPPDAHKGTFGWVLVVAGSRGMSGAAVLCGSGALRGGAGLVQLAVPEEILPLVAPGNACYLTAPLPGDGQGRLSAAARDGLLKLLADSSVSVVGPGLGQSADLAGLVKDLLAAADKPLALDADALNALRGQPDRLRACAAPVVVTPHPGEFARLVGSDIAAVQARRQELAARFAHDHGVVVVLKGHGTVVADGARV